MSEARGAQLYSAVERIVKAPREIEQLVAGFENEVDEAYPEATDEEFVEHTAQRIVKYYATRTMAAGGASSAPALIPGIGTLLALVPGNLADMTLCLKYEVEMVLALSVLYGFNIYDDYERSLAFLIASVSTDEILDGKRGIFKNATRVVSDVVEVEKQAFWNYKDRQIGKVLARVFVNLAIKAGSKGWLKAVPFAGIGISMIGNRLLTQRVGARAREALRFRVACEV